MAGADILRASLIGGDMTEDELLAGITEALTFGGWTWTHLIRSDGVTMGHAGLPDILAVHPQRELMLAWELKSTKGQLRIDQLRWLLALGSVVGVDARTIRPEQYDQALDVILKGRHPLLVWPARR